MEFRNLWEEKRRAPTSAEREHLAALKHAGVEDVYVAIEEAPEEFWRSVVIASRWYLASDGSNAYDEWKREYLWATGLPDFHWSASKAYAQIIEAGVYSIDSRYGHGVSIGQRLAAVEHLMDLVAEDDATAFARAVSDKARWLRIGVVIENSRFVPLESEHLHKEVVKPALLVLRQARYRDVDALYRKSFDRYFGHDHAGAITAATSAVEELLRGVLDESGGQLKSLLTKARSSGLIVPAVEQVAVKLGALRDESDAHTAGTDDPEVAMFAIHVAAAILRHLDAQSVRS